MKGSLFVTASKEIPDSQADPADIKELTGYVNKVIDRFGGTLPAALTPEGISP